MTAEKKLKPAKNFESPENYIFSPVTHLVGETIRGR